jgi:hypothetical protein
MSATVGQVGLLLDACGFGSSCGIWFIGDKKLAAIWPAWGLSHFCIALGGSPSDTFLPMLGSLVGA